MVVRRVRADRHIRAGSRPDVPATPCAVAARERADYLRAEAAALAAEIARLSRLIGWDQAQLDARRSNR